MLVLFPDPLRGSGNETTAMHAALHYSLSPGPIWTGPAWNEAIALVHEKNEKTTRCTDEGWME